MCLGIAQRGADNPAYGGGRYTDPNGYVHVLRPEHPAADVRGYVYEHRLIAEATVGRQLRTEEVVHHRNGRKDDNRPENLEVLASQAEHMARHAEVAA